jgi:hypothetical protein
MMAHHTGTTIFDDGIKPLLEAEKRPMRGLGDVEGHRRMCSPTHDDKYLKVFNDC